MRVYSFVFLILFSFTCLAQESIKDVAILLSKHKYKKLSNCFNDDMKHVVSVSDLRQIWGSLEQSGGKFQQLDNIEKKVIKTGEFQSALLRFEHLSMRIELSTDFDKKISGLMIRQLGYSLPDYGRNLGTGKKYVNFISEGYELSGELMIPLECSNCPVVVLVHGSGPNNKDEEIGPNKVFYDMAMGLAKNGIASYRYDKRSNLYPEVLDSQFDIYDETINDAIAALNIIRNDTSLHFSKYFMLGHSLGAYAMPLLADSCRNIDGAVLFSSNARRLEDLIEYQMEYLTGYDGKITKEEADLVANRTLNAQKIRSFDYDNSTKAEELLAYWPGTFWLGLDKYNPVEQVKENTKTPFLILQGEKDYQITMTDFNIWKDELSNQDNVVLKSYPNLTHLFTPSSAVKPGPNDYFVPQNVSYEVITDIANWIKSFK